MKRGVARRSGCNSNASGVIVIVTVAGTRFTGASSLILSGVLWHSRRRDFLATLVALRAAAVAAATSPSSSSPSPKKHDEFRDYLIIANHARLCFAQGRLRILILLGPSVLIVLNRLLDGRKRDGRAYAHVYVDLFYDDEIYNHHRIKKRGIRTYKSQYTGVIV